MLGFKFLLENFKSALWLTEMSKSKWQTSHTMFIYRHYLIIILIELLKKKKKNLFGTGSQFFKLVGR